MKDKFRVISIGIDFVLIALLILWGVTTEVKYIIVIILLYIVQLSTTDMLWKDTK